MPQEYEDLKTALGETGIPFAEYGWKTAPAGEYGVISLEFEADSLNGDDGKRLRAWEGSIDVYFRQVSRKGAVIEAVENVLKNVCDASWLMNSLQHESSTGLFHAEWVFQVEG